jgi:hypothetical protein
MSFINTVTALFILSFFFSGFSRAFLPVYNAWNKAQAEYNAAKTIHFIAESFRLECRKPDRNIERWKKTVAVAKELESYEISELKKDDVIYALKLLCVISGENLEILGLCHE